MGFRVSIELKDWKVKNDGEGKKICGTFVLKSGATEIATQSFNDGFSCTKVPFSTALQLKAEELTKEIEKEIQNNFTGGDNG